MSKNNCPLYSAIDKEESNCISCVNWLPDDFKCSKEAILLKL